jgi:hypothetical protein
MYYVAAMLQRTIVEEICKWLVEENKTLVALRLLCKQMVEFDDVIAKYISLNSKEYSSTSPFIMKWRNYVHTLDFPDFSAFPGIIRVQHILPQLKNIHTLYLSFTDVTDVSALGKVHTLILAYTKVTDVSALGKVHTLNLSYTKVTDVSMLGNVHTLNLARTNVTDVSALGNVHTLNLSGIRANRPLDVSKLGNVDTLNLDYSYVIDISMLKNVKRLRVYKTKTVIENEISIKLKRRCKY